MAEGKQTIFVAFFFLDDFIVLNQDIYMQMWYRIKVHVMKNSWISKVCHDIYV